MIEFDYRQERLRTGEIIFRPIAKVYLLKSGNEWIAEYFYVDLWIQEQIILCFLIEWVDF